MKEPIKNYQQLSIPQIKEKVEEIGERIMLSYGLQQKEKKQNRKRLRKERARLLTELNKRKQNG